MLDDLSAGHGPSRLKESTEPPRRSAVAYRIDERDYTADLYRPPGADGGAPLVLVPGAAEAGKDDPRLVAIANTLGRVGFLVLVPDIASLRALNVSASDAVEIAAALRHVAVLDTAGHGRRVGLVAISYAAGPAYMAALDPEAGPLVRFLVTIGGYYDLEAVITFFTTGYYRDGPDASWRYREPNAYGKWVFVRSNARRVETWRDRVLLEAMARRKLENLRAPIGDLAERLGPEGRAVHALLDNDDPEAVPELIAVLPAAIRAEIAALDLKRRDLSRLALDSVLIHGEDDPIIPETESQALARALPEGRVRLYLASNLMHADLASSGTADGLALLPAAYRVLALRDEILENRTD